MKLERLFLVCLLIVSWLVQPVAAQSRYEKQASELIDKFEKSGIRREAMDQLFRDCVLADGSVEQILDWLSNQSGDLTDSRSQVVAEIEVHLASRRGDLQRASDVLSRLLEDKEFADKRSDLRIWQAKLYDALGEVEKAKGIYQKLTQEDLSDQDQQAVRLRLALMGLIGDAGSKDKADAKPLIDLATKSDSVDFRNRTANVLAVQNRHADAIKLFTIQGEGTERFRSASRVTEWAIRAKDREKAIETAWAAVDAAQIKRDRNYALALLVESYRLKEKKKGLEALVAEFARRDESDEGMTDEMRSVWVDLLRELGQHEEAIALFQSTVGKESEFSVDMRRRLLEMEGEAGNEDRMIESYRQLIQAEPNELAWRAGLTQVLLEKGLDDQASDLWDGFIDQLQRGSLLLRSAQTLGEYGMDDLAKKAIERMVSLRVDHGQALLYWADLQQRRGNVEDSESTLNQIQTMDDVGDEVRAELASAYERLGRQDKAIEVNEAIRASRESVAEDLEMRLAWLYSEVGDEEKAQEQWLALWRKITSIPRRRYVEDRLMTVASRLGTLADIAIELEEKLADGTADEREAGLLVRIYSRVNDSVAATEISEEYMSKQGKNEVELLQEKGRIYQICNDYWNYEKVIERLIEVDPEGKTEYLRQLALSMLERGKAQEARNVLMTLREADDGKDTIGGEFEAGVLSLVGMNPEAADAYRKGIAKYPDRIESYLLLANLLKNMRQTERAVGMFQYLAENAERDDLFTIAIDGLLNMEAKGKSMQWARRITLERLAGREDKNYLYQLLSDLSAEVRDTQGQIRAMENSLAVAGTRRLSVLRECMELSSRIRSGAYYSSSSRGPTNKGNEPFFAFGRRLIGLGELMPPQVFLNLGQAFLDDGDIESAIRTFSMARNLADPRGYQREVALIFEKSKKLPEALARYEKLLRTSPSDVPLMARVAKLNEQLGKDEIAFRFYQKGLDLLLAQTPLTTQEEAKKVSYWSSNRDAYQTYSEQLLTGMLVTVGDDQLEQMVVGQLDELRSSAHDLVAAADTGRLAEKLADSPRIEKRSSNIRRICFALERIADIESMDHLLLTTFPKDENLLTRLARERIARGRYDSVTRMLETEHASDKQRQQLLVMLGETKNESQTAKLSPNEMWQRFLPVWMAGDITEARKILRRVDRSKGRIPGARPTYTVVNGRAVMQNAGIASDIGSWMRLALSLNDDSLALQFARSQLQQVNAYYSGGIKKTLSTYRSILPNGPYVDLVRYAANLYKDDASHLADYLWLISNMRDQLQADIPDDDKLLEMIEDSDLTINYTFPFELAIEAFPESIRAEALAATLDRINKKSRPRELVRIPFSQTKPIDEEVGKILVDSIKSGIEPAMQDNYLRYCTYYLPRNGQACKCPENAELAIKVLDLLQTEDVRKREATIPKMAEYIKAVVLHQSGRTDEALEIVLADYNPTETITDYYARYARDWAHRELIPAAPEKFVQAIRKRSKAEKPTTQVTDKCLQVIKQVGDAEKLRAAYKQAIEDHPDVSKYASEYEIWESKNRRTAAAIQFAESRLAKLDKNDKNKKSERIALSKQLAKLWLSVDHQVNALRYWKIADDADRQKFEEESKQRKQSSEAATEPDKAAPAKVVEKDQPSKKETAKPTKIYPSTIAGIKSAIDDENMEAASKSLRKLWRAFPPAVASPYGYRRNVPRINGLKWPSAPKQKSGSSEDTAEVSDEEKLAAIAAAEEKNRQRLRGGLATYVPEERKKPEPPVSAWTVLAEYPFAVDEMNRLLRSNVNATPASVGEVSTGLLLAQRKELGDQKVFDALVQEIESGHLSDSVLSRFFLMTDEDHSRITEANQAVIDTLLTRLDLTNARRAAQLAKLCGNIGQRARASSLFQHCALLSASGQPPFASLVASAAESFSGVDLLELVEKMFVVSSQDAAAITQLLDLRLEFLDPPTAAQRTRKLFEDSDLDTNQLVWWNRAAEIFSQAGDEDFAAKCFKALLQRHGKPRVLPSNYYGYSTSNSRNLVKVTRADLIRLFPTGADKEVVLRYEDYGSWLDLAAKISRDLSEDPEVDREFLLEVKLLIALRQAEIGSTDDAIGTLESISKDSISQTKSLEMLAVDVMRAATATELALDLQTSIYEGGRLSHVRFGDMLRDTSSVHGGERAEELFDELVSQSMDKDLMKAALDVSEGSESFSTKVQKLQQELEKATEQYESRQDAARDRQEQRQKWQAAKPKPTSKPGKAAVPLP